MLSMLSESVEEREEKLLEGVKKIESSELSNQKEADILSRQGKVSQCMPWAADKKNYGSCSSELQSAKPPTGTEHTEADNCQAFQSQRESSRFVCGKINPSLQRPG